MLFTLSLGDWMQDGNCVHEDYLFDCNYPVEQIAEAYKASCRKYGVQFNSADNDYIDPASDNRSERESWRHIWGRYDSNLDPTAYVVLEQAGVLDGDNVVKAVDGSGFYVDDEAGLVMRFIALSMPKDFSYKLVEVPSLNRELRVNICYGLSAV